MLRDVSGLTKHDAPSAAVMPAGSGRQSPALMTRYCADHGDRLAGQRLRSTRRAGLFYDAGPSLPTGRDLSSRPVVVLSEAWETSALTAMLSLVPDNVPWDMSAVPTKIPRSDGLIGDA